MPLRLHLAAALLFAATPLALAQSSAPAPTPDAKPLAFEVASIRPHDGPLYTVMGYTASGPRLRLEGDNLRSLVMEAYHLKYYQVDIPESIARSNDFYDVVAVAPDGPAPTHENFCRMLQTLLADRLQLKAHFEKKDTPVYALVIAKGGPKLAAATTEAPHAPNFHGVNGRNQFLKTDSITMPDLAEDLNNTLGTDRPIIDRTGLTGTYKLRIEATPDWRNRDPQPGDLSIFTAVQEQLGLKLEPATAPLDILVIDSAQKPSEN